MLETPEASIEVTLPLVSQLINDQIHELSDLPLEFLDAGWDNVMYRLGEEYIVRLPRRKIGAELIRNEQRYVDHLPTVLPIKIPRTIFVGKPQNEYPYNWSLLPFYSGEAADTTTVAPEEAVRFTDFLKAIHKESNGLAPINNVRGVSLSTRAKIVEQRLFSTKVYLEDKYESILRIWKEALAADEHAKDLWIHGDLHPKNVLVANGQLEAIIDWGDITSGDVATDLASIWMLFDEPLARADAIANYQMDTALLARTKGWVIYFASVFYQNGLTDNPRHLKIGEKAFSRLLKDFA